MKKERYYITSKAGANLRLYPSGSYPTKEPVGHLGYLSPVEVIADWEAVNSVGTSTRYLPVLVGGSVRYVAAELVGKPDCAQRAAMAAEHVYQRIYDLQAVHKSASSVISLATLEEHRRISCGRAASIVMQLAGMLPVGRILSHTEADGKGGITKTTMPKSMTGYHHLITGSYSMERVNCLYSALPERYKAAGVIYVQDSNVCVSAGGGRIYSCNKSGKRYGEGGEAVLRNGGYPFTAKILYVVAPRGE